MARQCWGNTTTWRLLTACKQAGSHIMRGQKGTLGAWRSQIQRRRRSTGSRQHAHSGPSETCTQDMVVARLSSQQWSLLPWTPPSALACSASGTAGTRAASGTAAAPEPPCPRLWVPSWLPHTWCSTQRSRARSGAGPWRHAQQCHQHSATHQTSAPPFLPAAACWHTRQWQWAGLVALARAHACVRNCLVRKIMPSCVWSGMVRSLWMTVLRYKSIYK